MNCVKRIALMVIRNILLVPFMWCKLCYYAAHVDKYPEITRYKLLKYIVKRANKGGNVTIEAYGKENIPKEGGFMFFPNHQGLYDVLAIVDACPRPFSVVAKKEVANVPLLKQTFKCMKAYMIDREDVRQSLQVIVNVSNDVKNGRNFLIFPEGTRSRMGNQLLPFKGGTFKSAVRAKCPIVPCALIDSYKPFDEKSIAPVTVKLIYLPPICYEEYKQLKTPEIADIVKTKIEEAIRQYS